MIFTPPSLFVARALYISSESRLIKERGKLNKSHCENIKLRSDFCFRMRAEKSFTNPISEVKHHQVGRKRILLLFRLGFNFSEIQKLNSFESEISFSPEIAII